MADTRLTTDANERPSGPVSLWPFPGILLFLMFAAWLFYMGSISGMEDVATAFYGLGAVTLLLVALGLRAASAGRVRRRSGAGTALAPRRRRHAGRSGALAEDSFAPRRSAIVDEGAIPSEGAIYPGGGGGGGGGAEASGIPLNARMRARRDEVRATTGDEEEVVEVEVNAPSPRRPEPTDAAYEAADSGDDADGEPVAARQVVAEAVPGQDDPRIAQLRRAVRQLEASTNRERAERGAQLAKLEQVVKDVDALRAAGAQPADAGEPASDRVAELAAALDALAARVAAMEAGGGPPPTAPEDGLTLAHFNAAVDGELLPRITRMVDERLAAALDREGLRALLDSPAGADGAAAAVPDDRAAGLEAAIATARDAATAERDALKADLQKVHRMAQRAFAVAIEASRAVGEVGEGETPLAEQVTEVRAALSGSSGGALPAAAGALEQRLAAAMRELEEMRGNLGAVTQHVARMGEHYQDLVARLDRIGEQIAGEPRRAAGAAVQGEVDALRDALTTIIEQNREIRAQQEMLSARFEGPRGSER
jgi:regulator of replication initiation timing